MGDPHHHDQHAHDGHGHDGHSHGVSADADRRWLTIALALIGVFMAGEVVAGLIAHSLALLSDAAHMLTDAGGIVLALVAIRLAARPPKGGFTFGLKRAEILSAQANGLTMLILAVWLAIEAVRRLLHPPEVAGGLVLVTALVGIAFNVAATWAIGRANRASLNVEGAFQHILNDLFAFIATAVAGLIVLLTGYTRADAVATLIVVALMVKAGLRLIRESGKIFLEAAPSGIDPPALGRRLTGVGGVVEVHDLHVWQITSGQPALSAHVLVAEGLDCHAIRGEIEQLLRRDYKITHSTLQVDHANPAEHCEDAHGIAYRPA
ncbi:cation diffusion facilitator family transporter [Actinoplanes sp. KI2]|uniref:cation diffusion facilitator family transporter n=1 Tax=Actinoplanes sp. KI2 TaxID=2983315 RepID=UPI0021D56FCE|nr:cation diffusion facilitator family transporter [Actinoplanes sp. KI2]MCU7728164.1 cation diffusion facilitator family transporter [Actinoplanes sp. KI2]